MLYNWPSLVARETDAPSAQSTTGTSHTMTILLAVLLVLIVLVLLLVGGLLLLRRRRLARKQEILPIYDEKRASTSSSSSSAHRRVLTRPTDSAHVSQEKQTLMDNSDSPPPSPLPEIRITLPEEVDEAGKRLSGRVVVVHVGEVGVALEPAETLPAYQQHEGARFQSLDLDRIGGLVEKENEKA